MIEYVIVCSDEAEDLEKLVNSFIEDGWKPQGGLAIAYNCGYSYRQAMVRKKKNVKQSL